MKRLFLGVLAACLVAAAVAFSANNPALTGLQITEEARNPWNHLRLNNAPGDFQFAIVSDRTGGHRERVFSLAVEQLNLLQPEFVVSVGDLIEGYKQDPKKLGDEWREFQTFINRLEMPFFYVPGNHDIANAFQDKVWAEKFGRRYYHFVYRNVLFLMVNSEDPPGERGQVSEEQRAYLKKALDENPAVRWTLVFLHKPLWAYGEVEKTGWLEVEKLLTGRQYTVFAGHVHRYQKFVRQGQRYYQLATTGGGSKLRGVQYGEFDHIVWVTMKNDGPVLANIMLDGILPEDVRKPATVEPGVVVNNRKPTHPVQGRVYFEGCPVPGAIVVFHFLEKDKKPVRAGDALVEADGTFVLSTYTAGDGAPAGDFAVTVVWPKPRFDEAGKPGPNQLPEVYAKVDTTPLKAVIKAGNNEVELDLKK